MEYQIFVLNPGIDDRQRRTQTALMVLMELSRIMVNESADRQVIWLREVEGERQFPIEIGNAEAVGITHRLNGSPSPRPQTHDLLANTIEALGGTLDRIEVTELRDATFFAQLVVKQKGEEIVIDSRPSDAIALGIAGGVPIYVAEQVLENL